MKFSVDRAWKAITSKADCVTEKFALKKKKAAGNPDAAAAHQPTESPPNSTSAKIIKL